MARYIEAEALKKVMCEGCDNVHLCAESPACETVQQIDAQPTIDVDYERGFIEGYTKAESDIFHGGKYAPVKPGRWELKYYKRWGGYFPTCTVCGNPFYATRYCPNCGAKMDESTMGQVNRHDAVNEELKP